MWKPDYDQEANYWIEKDALNEKLEESKLKERIRNLLSAHNTCSLATGCDGFVRCTPIEYNYFDGVFYMISEGGLKFKSLKGNKNVSIAIYDEFKGFDKLKGLQVQGVAYVIEPFSEEYIKFLNHRRIPVEAMKKYPKPMNLIRVVPQCFDLVDSSLKKEGFEIRQHLDVD